MIRDTAKAYPANPTNIVRAFQKSKTQHPVRWQRLRKLKVISLFAGAGGLDLGFIQAGHQVIWANDHDPDSVDTYRTNIDKHIVLGDIADFDPRITPSADVLIGGLPCQGFSLANINKIDNDARNDLHAQFVRFLIAKRPKFFMIENVRGMLSLDGGKVFERILSSLEKAGYLIDYKLLNAADFGVPQTRIRLLIIGVRWDLRGSHRYVFPRPTHSKDRSGGSFNKSWITIKAALKGIPEPKAKHCLLNHVGSQYKVTNRNFTGHRRTDPSKPSPTILARGDGKGGVCAIQHPRNHRRLTVRESAIIQTFPIDFEFKGKINSMYRQVGNAVPVRLARYLASGFQERH